MRILFRINLGLGFSSFSLGHHISNSKGILEGIGISRRLNSFTLRLLFWPRNPYINHFLFLNPSWDLNPLRRVLGGERLLRRRKRKGCERRKSSWILYDIFWIVYLVYFPQIGVSKDSCLIKGVVVRFNTLVLVDYCYLRGQPCLCLHYSTLVSYCLRGFNSFIGHL